MRDDIEGADAMEAIKRLDDLKCRILMMRLAVLKNFCKKLGVELTNPDIKVRMNIDNSNLDESEINPDGWRTLENGTRINLSETGEILAGMGGKYTGQNIAEINRSTKRLISEYDTTIDRAGHLKDMMTKEEAVSFFRRYGDPSLTDDEILQMCHCTLQYTGGFSYSLVEYQRAGRVTKHDFGLSHEELDDFGSKIDNFIANSPKFEGGPLYRGLTLSRNDLNSIGVGNEFDMGSVSSWSDSKNVAVDFASRSRRETEKVVFVAPHTNVGASIAGVSKYTEQREVLIPRTARWQVERVERARRNEAITYVYLNELA